MGDGVREQSTLILIRGTVLMSLVAVLTLSACGSSSSPTSQSTGASPTAASSPPPSPTPTAGSNGPTRVVDQYWTALEGGDCTTAFGLLVDAAKSKVIAASNLCKSIQIASVRSFQIGAVTGQTTSSAMVKVTVQRGGGSPDNITTMSVTLVGDTWKISDFSA